jgi:hypothetical protein
MPNPPIKTTIEARKSKCTLRGFKRLNSTMRIKIGITNSNLILQIIPFKGPTVTESSRAKIAYKKIPKRSANRKIGKDFVEYSSRNFCSRALSLNFRDKNFNSAIAGIILNE